MKPADFVKNDYFRYPAKHSWEVPVAASGVETSVQG
jgi:hypothetical protein